MKETIFVNNQQFLIDSNRHLTPEEKSNVINQIAQQFKSNQLNQPETFQPFQPRIQSLAASVTVTYQQPTYSTAYY